MVNDNIGPTIRYVIDPVGAVKPANYVSVRKFATSASRITSATDKNEMTLFIGT